MAQPGAQIVEHIIICPLHLINQVQNSSRRGRFIVHHIAIEGLDGLGHLLSPYQPLHEGIERIVAPVDLTRTARPIARVVIKKLAQASGGMSPAANAMAQGLKKIAISFPKTGFERVGLLFQRPQMRSPAWVAAVDLQQLINLLHRVQSYRTGREIAAGEEFRIAFERSEPCLNHCRIQPVVLQRSIPSYMTNLRGYYASFCPHKPVPNRSSLFSLHPHRAQRQCRPFLITL
ncbi:MAG: hypothetical protein ETSY1_30170 [Candidatus Entotheonella factor]|uniref:Uncharacterized protein n=1 Tax=Entotheonella factor TaxID=1429438 RepID=W4LC85_ENTF1|nr:MAG: hypothetical protein ETSY1_30170 [Candidatus Entotheonella factor]